MSVAAKQSRVCLSALLVVATGFASGMAVRDVSAASSGPLRYGWGPGRQFAYRVEITADRDDHVDTMQGVIVYTGKASQGEQLMVSYRGGLTRSKKMKPGKSFGAGRPPFGPRFGPRFGPPSFGHIPFGPFSGTSFRGLVGSTTNELVLTTRGEIQSLAGDSQLPYLMGNLSILVFEPLPEAREPSWTIVHGVTITEKNERRGPPFFVPPPFAQGGPDKQTGASETTSYKIEDDAGPLVKASKRYKLNSPTTDGESVTIEGSGTWVFDTKLGVSESLDLTQTLTARDGNKTIAVPMTVKYTRLSDEEFKAHLDEQKKRQEEAQARLAEMQRKQAEEPLADDARKSILDGLRSDKWYEVMRALQRLSMKSPKEPDAEMATAIRRHLKDDNAMVRKIAEDTAAKWPLPEGAAKRVRTWTDDTGSFTVEAEFLGVEDGNVRLRRADGREIRVPLARLGKADRKAAEDLDKEHRAKTNPFEP